MKACGRCGLVKNDEDFYKSSKYGLQSYCKFCVRDYYQANRTEILRLTKLRAIKNRDKKRLYAHEYYNKHKNIIIQRSKDRYRKNKGK